MSFVGSLITRPDLFFDEFIRFVAPEDAGNLCDAMAVSAAAHHVLTDEQRWTYLMESEGLLPRTLGGRIVSAEATELGLKSSTPSCPQVSQYLSRLAQRLAFDENVLVVSGSIGTISTVGNGIPVDCLVFPTSHQLQNPHSGAAACVHARAGPQLDNHVGEYLRTLQAPLPVGTVVLTPAFNANTQALIHCLGPSGMAQNRALLLYTTYINAFIAMEKHATVRCAAIASISTGNLRFPIDEAATIAMSAVRDMICSRRWTTVLAFVCIDPALQRELELAKAAIRSTLFHGGYTYPDVITGVPPP